MVKRTRVQQVDIKTGAVLRTYDSISEAARAMGTVPSSINAAVHLRTTSAGFHWRPLPGATAERLGMRAQEADAGRQQAPRLLKKLRARLQEVSRLREQLRQERSCAKRQPCVKSEVAEAARERAEGRAPRGAKRRREAGARPEEGSRRRLVLTPRPARAPEQEDVDGREKEPGVKRDGGAGPEAAEEEELEGGEGARGAARGRAMTAARALWSSHVEALEASLASVLRGALAPQMQGALRWFETEGLTSLEELRECAMEPDLAAALDLTNAQQRLLLKRLQDGPP